MSRRATSKLSLLALLLSLIAVPETLAASSGGPDAFGYEFIDSTEVGGPAYNFEDISSSGTNIALGDNQVSGAINIGFTFSFYGVNYSQVYVSSNGFLTFLSGQSSSAPTTIPAVGNPNAIIAGWAADLYPPDFGAIRYKTLGSSPNRRFIVQYTYIGHSPSGSGNLVTFETKLFEGTNTIEVHHSAAPSNGTTHSVGIENETGNFGLQYYSGTSPLAFPCAVRFYDCRLEVSHKDDFYSNGPKGGAFAPSSETYTLKNNGTTAINWTATKSASWLNVTPASGTIQAGDTLNVSVSINANANSLDYGTYTDTVTLANTTTGITEKRNVTLLISDIVSSSHPWPSLWYFGKEFYADWVGYQPANAGYYFWKLDTLPTTPVTAADSHMPVTQHGVSPATTELDDWTHYFHLSAADATSGLIIPGVQRNLPVNMAGYPPNLSSSSHPSLSTVSKSTDFIVSDIGFNITGIPSPDLQDGFESYGFGGIPWQVGGTDFWRVRNNSFYSNTGNCSAFAYQYSNRGPLRLETGCQHVSFCIQSQHSADYWRFYVDGILKGSWSDTYNWYDQKSFDLPLGQHVLEWVPYSNLGYLNYNVSLDDVVITGIPPVPAKGVIGYWYKVSDNPIDLPQKETDNFSDTFPIIVPNNAPGSHWFHVLAEDTVGNLSECAHFLFTVTAASPQVSVSPQSSPSTAYPQRDVAVSWNDGGQPTGQFAGYYWCWDQAASTEPSPSTDTFSLATSAVFQNQSIGTHYLHIRSIDKYGELSPVTHQKVQIREATPPLISATNLQNGVLSLTWSNPDNFADHYYYVFDHIPDTQPQPGGLGVIRLNGAARNEIDVSTGEWYCHVRGADQYENLSATGHLGVWAGPVALSISAPSITSARNGDSVSYTIMYYGATSISLGASNITLNPTGTATASSKQVSGSGSTRTVTLSGLSGEGTLGISLAANTASGASGNAPAAGPSQVFSVDAQVPTVVISSTASAVTSVSPIPVTVTFSEPVSGFDATDVVVGNCQKQDFTASGDNRIWTFNLVPQGQGQVTVDIAAGVAADLAGNPNTAAARLTRTYDTIAPTGSLTINSGATWTKTANVTLGLTYNDGSGVTQMRFSDDGSTWTAYENVVATKAWSLSAGDGVKTIRVQYKDGAGNESQPASATIKLDATRPTGTVSISGGANFTATRTVTLTLSGDDGTGSGVNQMSFSSDGITFNAWETFATTKTLTLSTGDGVKTVYAQFRDVATNVSQIVTATITLDMTAPTGGSIVINNNATYTNSANVTLTLNASDGATGSGVAQMRFSNNGSDWGTGWEPFATTKSWPLTAGNGAKTVYVQFADALGNTSGTYSDGITLDTTVVGVTLSSTVADYCKLPFTVTATFTTTVTGFDRDDVTVTNATVSGFAGTGTSYQWTVTPALEGEVTVAVAAGTCTNVAGSANTASNTLNTFYDITPPIATVSINGGASFTSNQSVMLTILGNDSFGSGTSTMRLSNDGISWGNWETFATPKSWTLATGDSVKTVYLKLVDNAGNESSIASDTITLDMTAPTGSVLINGGATYSNSRNATLTLSASDGSGSGMGQMRISHDGTNWDAWEDYAASKAWTLTAGDGSKTVYVQFRDALNNTSAAFTDTIVLDMTAPGVTAQQVSTHMNTARSITLAGTDAGSAPVAYSVTVSPTHGTLSGTAPALSYMPSAYYVGGDEFTFQVTDGAGNANTAVVTITITNTAPVAANKEVSTLMNSPVSIALGVSDANGDAITSCDVVDGPSHGTLSGTGTNRTYTPDAGYHGSDEFTFQACDGQADSNVATVSIDVIPTGSLTVTITPDAAVARGGQWCVDGGPWRVSGATVSGLTVGEHVVTFYDIPKLKKSGCETPKNYDTPASRTVTIVVGETLEITETYQQSTQSTAAGVSGLTGDSLILVGVIGALFASRFGRRSYRAGSQRTL